MYKMCFPRGEDITPLGYATAAQQYLKKIIELKNKTIKNKNYLKIILLPLYS